MDGSRDHFVSGRSPDASPELGEVRQAPGDGTHDLVLEQRFELAYNYPVAFTRGFLNPANSTLANLLNRSSGPVSRACPLFVVIDEGVADAWPHLEEQLADYLAERTVRARFTGPGLIVKGGESCKNDSAALQKLYEQIRDFGLDRHAVVMAIGGGAVLDMVGYGVATAHRGLRMLRVPTTVLGQCDSGVGVKNGINAFGTKNFLGTFAPPFAVINDFEFLQTLDERDRYAGMAEAVKVALIRDREFFYWLEENQRALAVFESQAVATLIKRAGALHLRHIAQSGDPFEFGSARPLDFGHWVAHKLESLSGHRLRHGEAVSVGLALDAWISQILGGLPDHEWRHTIALLKALRLPIWDPCLELEGDSGLAILDGLEEFRQHIGGQLDLTMLRSIGHGFQVQQLDPEWIVQAVAALKDWAR